MLISLPRRSFAGWIFDCDGTLIDSMPTHHRAWQIAFQESGADFEFSWELFMRRAGLSLESTVQELNVEFGQRLDPAVVCRRQRAAFLDLRAELRPIEAVVRLAREFDGPMAVASGGDRDIVLDELRATGLLDLFVAVVCAADVPRGKPSPDMMLRCAELMQVPPRDCLVFEDAAAGLEAARRAGMGWVAVDGSGRSSDPVGAARRS